jgi:hypothetical protein
MVACVLPGQGNKGIRDGPDDRCDAQDITVLGAPNRGGL